MQYRLLGRSGLQVSAFSFGAMTFGGLGYFASVGATQAADARRQVDMALDAGVNLFDTADIYSQGRSEELLAEALGPRRPQVVIATKAFGVTGHRGVNDRGASRRHLVAACEASLRRLNTDYIDLYQIHNQDRLTPPEETLRALDDLVSAGKVRYIGSSNHAGWWQMKALATSDRLGLVRYVSQQIQYSLRFRDSEAELLPLGVEEGVGALIYSGLARGYLTGKFRGGDPGETRIAAHGNLHDYDTPHGRRILQAIDEVVAGRPGVTASQVALNWVVRRPGVASVIIGARTSEQLADNLAASTWSLSDAEMARLDEASALTLPYPYARHLTENAAHNPQPPLQPPL